MVKKPSDLGFSDEGYELPPLITNKHMVHNSNTWCIDGQTSMFAMPAQTMTEGEAFALLRSGAMQTRLPLADMARAVVDAAVWAAAAAAWWVCRSPRSATTTSRR